MKYLTPADWVEKIEKEVALAEPGHVVISPELIKRFDELDTMAVAHAKAKGEHEAMLYLTLYAIWKGSLWKARWETWEDYCDEWDKSGLGFSKSTIKHKVQDVRRMIAAGVSNETVIKALSSIPMAARMLMAELMDEGDNVKPDVREKIPEKLTVDEYLNELSELGPGQAKMAVGEMAGAVFVRIENLHYDSTERVIDFTATCDSDGGRLTSDLSIPRVPDWAAKAIIKRLS